MRLPTSSLIKPPYLAALAIISLWCLLTLFILYSNKATIDKTSTSIQLFFYAVLAFLAWKAYRKPLFNKKEKSILCFLFILIAIALFTNLVNYIAFNLLNHDNFFLHKSKVIPFIDSYLKVFDYGEIFIWYLLIVCFLVLILHWFFKKNFYLKPHFYIFSILLFVGLSALLLLCQPNGSSDFHTYDFIAYISSVIVIFIFVISIYGLIYSKNLSAYLLFASMIIMMLTQVTALFYYSYHIEGFMKAAYSAWLLWVLLAILTLFNINYNNQSIEKSWFADPASLEASLAYKTLVITSLCLAAFFIFSR